MSNEPKNNSKGLLAFILIFVGAIWLIRQLGIYNYFPDLHIYNIFHPMQNVLHKIWHLVFSWPVILIIIGLILLAGKRSSGGLILIIIGGLFLLPKIFILPGITAVLIFPFVLIGLGVALIAKII
ncbi:MAG: hypothetical protein JXR31_12395 [Prolixibacteraceae bacterium]|nr:hypothetical protein [Prolixibacteraceae bacterium]MBN2775046.1 hypothetical protein [Prolixibacteraceae bacterium]